MAKDVAQSPKEFLKPIKQDLIKLSFSHLIGIIRYGKEGRLIGYASVGDAEKPCYGRELRRDSTTLIHKYN